MTAVVAQCWEGRNGFKARGHSGRQYETHTTGSVGDAAGGETVNAANFGPLAEDEPVCGACRPGHLGADLAHWTGLLHERGVSTVVCLLSEGESKRWGLPDAYGDRFETAHLPIRDRHLPERDRLAETLDFLDRATESGRVALHCNAGLGRTGVVGAAWLARQGYAPQEAVEAVESAPAPRAPREAIREGNATEADLYDLLSVV